MATIHVWSGATGANDGTSWTDAYTSFASAVTNVTNSDEILVHYTHSEGASGDTTYTFTNTDVRVYSVDKDSSDALTAMGTSGSIDASGSLTIFGATDGIVYFHGITLDSTAGTPEAINVRSGTRGAVEFEDCYLWMSGNNSASSISLIVSTDDQGYIRFKECTFRFASSDQHLILGGRIEIEGGEITSAGTAIDEFFQLGGRNPGTNIYFNGFDLTHMGTTPVLCELLTGTASLVIFNNCKLPSNLTFLGSQTSITKGAYSVLLFDCAQGDSHIEIGYADPRGTLTVDTSINFTTGAAGLSWKIVTTANCSFEHPFVTPWIDLFHDGTSAITPRLEILRDGSATAYQDDEVWGEFGYKGTTGNVLLTFVNDRMTPRGTAANQAAGAGLGSWTGEGGTAWSGKVEATSSITPAETGYIRGRVCVGEPSSTVYVDPQIRF